MAEHDAPAVQAAVEAVIPVLAASLFGRQLGSGQLRALAFDAACAAVDAAKPVIAGAERKRLAGELERRASVLDADQPTSAYAHITAVNYREAAQVIREQR